MTFSATAEQIRAAVLKKQTQFTVVRNCSICNSDIGYQFEHSGDGVNVSAAFDRNCDCCLTRSIPDRVSFLNIAATINSFDCKKTRKEILEGFGVEFDSDGYVIEFTEQMKKIESQQASRDNIEQMKVNLMYLMANVDEFRKQLDDLERSL